MAVPCCTAIRFYLKIDFKFTFQCAWVSESMWLQTEQNSSIEVNETKRNEARLHTSLSRFQSKCQLCEPVFFDSHNLIFQFATAMTTVAPDSFNNVCGSDLFVCSCCTNLFWRRIVNSHRFPSSLFGFTWKMPNLNDYVSWLPVLFASLNIHFRHWHSLCPNPVEIVVFIVITSLGNQIEFDGRWLINVSTIQCSLNKNEPKHRNQMEQVSKITAERRHDLLLLLLLMHGRCKHFDGNDWISFSIKKQEVHQSLARSRAIMIMIKSSQATKTIAQTCLPACKRK